MHATTAQRLSNKPDYTTSFPKSVTIAPVGDENAANHREWFPVNVAYSRSSGWEFSLAMTPNGEPERVCHAPSFRAGGAEANGERLHYHW